MKHNFDETVDRKNSDCIKYDFAVERGMPVIKGAGESVWA